MIDLDAQSQEANVAGGAPADTMAESPQTPPMPSELDAEPMSDVDQVLSEPDIEPQNEDALSRLVREAMQRAVESARTSE